MSTPISTALETPVYCSGSANSAASSTFSFNNNASFFYEHNAAASPYTLTACAGKTALDLGFDVADGRYEKVIIYTGTCFVGAAVVVIMGWVMEVRQRVRAAGMET